MKKKRHVRKTRVLTFKQQLTSAWLGSCGDLRSRFRCGSLPSPSLPSDAGDPRRLLPLLPAAARLLPLPPRLVWLAAAAAAAVAVAGAWATPGKGWLSSRGKA